MRSLTPPQAEGNALTIPVQHNPYQARFMPDEKTRKKSDGNLSGGDGSAFEHYHNVV